MKSTPVLGILIAGSLLAANAAPKDDVIAAAKKLGRTSYSWNSTSTHLERGGPGGPEGGGGPGGPPPGGGAIEGKASQDGVIAVSMALREGAVEVIKQGGKTVFNSGQSWEAAGDPADAGPGPDGFIAMMAQSITAPAAEAQDLAAKAAGLDLVAGAYLGELSEADAQAVALPFWPPPGGEGPTVSNAKASVRFWVQNGVLTRYELKTSAKVNFDGDERDLDRTTTVEIKDVGTTTVVVPEEAKKLLQ